MRINVSHLLSVTLFVCLAVFTADAQTSLDEAVRRADVSPAWPNCDPIVPDCTKSRLADFIAANLQYPKEAKEANAGGLVMMEFVIEKNGNIGEVRPVMDPGKGLGKEATRVIELMKTKKIKWSPAKNDGKKVAYRYTVPISFNLNAAPKEAAPATSAAPVPDTDKVYDIADVMPQYEGCADSPKGADNCTYSKVVELINANLTYPQEAIDNDVEGQVIVEFVIGIDGKVTNPKIVRGLGSGCDEEVLRIIGLMPEWVPGQLSGTKVKVKKTLPVLFKMPKEDQK